MRRIWLILVDPCAIPHSENTSVDTQQPTEISNDGCIIVKGSVVDEMKIDAITLY